MNLLVVGHPFLLAHNQKKYVALRQLGAEIRLLVWEHTNQLETRLGQAERHLGLR